MRAVKKTLACATVFFVALGAPFELSAEDSPGVSVETSTATAELDAYWARVASFLGEGDFDGVVSTYHPDAVLVSEIVGTSYPITQALKRWKPGIMDTAAGKATSFVEFRIGRRLFDARTSHEKGIFHFRSGPTGPGAKDEDMQEAWVHFEALLVKEDDVRGWTMVMEYQKQLATKSEWEALDGAEHE